MAVEIEVVAVELHGVASAARVVDGPVPAATDTEVFALGDDMDDARVAGRQLLYQRRGAVGAMVVHHEDVEVEASLLPQGRLHRVADGLGAVEHGDDDGGRDGEVVLHIGLLVAVGMDEAAHCPQVLRHDLLHLHLHVAVARIDIVKLSFAFCAHGLLLLRVEVFVEVEDRALPAQLQTQVVPATIQPVGAEVATLDRVRPDEHQRPEVEVVSQRTLLVVYHGVLRPLSLLRLVEVGIDHDGPRAVGHLEQPLLRAVAQGDGVVGQLYQYVLCARCFRHLSHCRRRGAGRVEVHTRYSFSFHNAS